MNWREIWVKLHAQDWTTWIGHGLLGFLIGLVGWQYVLGAFAYREASDLINWYADPREAAKNDAIYREGKGTFKRDVGGKLKDGFFDLWAPLAGAALAEIVKAL